MWRHQHPSLALPIHTTNTTSWYTRVNKALGLSSWTIFLVNTKIICWICFEDSRFLYYFWTIPINILYMYTPAECVVLPGKWYTWKRTSENMQLVRCGGKKYYYTSYIFISLCAFLIGSFLSSSEKKRAWRMLVRVCELLHCGISTLFPQRNPLYDASVITRTMLH